MGPTVRLATAQPFTSHLHTSQHPCSLHTFCQGDTQRRCTWNASSALREHVLTNLRTYESSLILHPKEKNTHNLLLLQAIHEVDYTAVLFPGKIAALFPNDARLGSTKPHRRKTLHRRRQTHRLRNGRGGGM